MGDLLRACPDLTYVAADSFSAPALAALCEVAHPPMAFWSRYALNADDAARLVAAGHRVEEQRIAIGWGADGDDVSAVVASSI